MMFIGAVAGLAAVVALIALFVLYRRQQRQLSLLQRWAGTAPERARRSPAVPAPPATPPRRRRRSGKLRTATAVAATLAVAAAGAGVGLIVRVILDARTPTTRTGAAQAARPVVDDISDLPLRRRAAIPVAVLNASSVPGAARSTAQRLHTLGFALGRVANAPQPADASEVAYTDADGAGVARAIARLLGGSRSERATRAVRATAGKAEVVVTVGPGR